MRIHAKQLVLVSAIFSVINCAKATELVYVPVNPSFGGNPANGVVLLNSASATNKHKEDVGLGGASALGQSAVEQFNETLARTVLGQLASAATTKLIGQDGKLLPGTFSTNSFSISVIDLGAGVLRITTTDKTTNATTSFEVGQ
jgi:curli production assembly/transport component CsgF